MPTWGVVVLRFNDNPDYVQVNEWRRDLLTEVGCDGFINPLTWVVDEGSGPIPIADGSYWYDLNVCKTYYGDGYARGDANWFVQLAEWLESRIPNGEVWYGHDIDDRSIEPFDEPRRAALLEHFHRYHQGPDGK